VSTAQWRQFDLQEQLQTTQNGRVKEQIAAVSASRREVLWKSASDAR